MLRLYGKHAKNFFTKKDEQKKITFWRVELCSVTFKQRYK
ncbi:hypothetical protein BN8_04604 [Fibrisoma limi BUZ 3]|uniref:Uncharacterized protein n=1 Tax=Fibrisoma limi BUZ 3 TaxID=1185876 RepID=I2GN72_9BACT|nr:hypothetical protein BN8_04604 [Fibrisoma limi BUZ 3]